MRKQTLIAIFTTSAFVLTAVPFLQGQFPAESTIPKAQRKGNGRVKKGPPGPTPRMADGHVDLSGVWGYAGYTSDIAKDYDVGELPMTPFGEKLFKERQANEGTEDPEARCLPTGVPRRDPYPSKILQLPNLVVILYEGNLHSFRQIFLNRDHPKDLNPTWWGDSVGKWEGDELVVDTIGFNGLTWLDLAGHGTSDKLHVIERYSRPDYGNLKDEITIEDPVYFTRPWKLTQWTPLITDSDLWEYICTENEKDSKHLDTLIKADKEAKAKAAKKSSDWKQHGIRIVRAGELDTNTPQTAGMSRAAAITHARTGANKLWAGTVTVQPAARTGAHHHGELETVLYIIRGRARFRWGDHLEFVEEAGPGDFIYVPPFVPHQEMNARPDEPVEAVVVRSGQEPIVVNLDIESPEPAPHSPEPDPFHSKPHESG